MRYTLALAAALAAATLIVATAVAFAEPVSREKLREICRADYEKYCANVQRGGGRIKQCMRDNRDRLSEPCRKAMDDNAAAKSSAAPAAQ